jgi:hypothetical protein
MAIEIDDPIFKYHSPQTLESAGGSLTTGSLGAATNGLAVAQHLDAPEADWALEIDLASAPANGKSVHLYGQARNVIGANSAPAPDVNYPHTDIGTFPVKAASGLQRIPLFDAPLLADALYHIHNDTGVTINSWKLYATPKVLGVKNS